MNRPSHFPRQNYAHGPRYPMHMIVHIIKPYQVINTSEIGSHDVTSQAAGWPRRYVMTSFHAAEWSRNNVGYLGRFNDLSDRTTMWCVTLPMDTPIYIKLLKFVNLSDYSITNHTSSNTLVNTHWLKLHTHVLFGTNSFSNHSITTFTSKLILPIGVFCNRLLFHVV